MPLAPLEDRIELSEVVTRLSVDHGAYWLDLSDDSRFEDSDFYDADHLSEAGAVKFTEILTARVGQILTC